MWCVLSEEELRKCEAFAAATADDQMKTNEQAFGSYYRKVKTLLIVNLDFKCKGESLNEYQNNVSLNFRLCANGIKLKMNV